MNEVQFWYRLTVVVKAVAIQDTLVKLNSIATLKL